MRMVIQRVKHASVTVDGEITGKIGQGFLVLLGIGPDDTEEIVEKMADKMMRLRIFSDENDKINRSLSDVDGELLLVSQFTLYADCRKGNRPALFTLHRRHRQRRSTNIARRTAAGRFRWWSPVSLGRICR